MSNNILLKISIDSLKFFFTGLKYSILLALICSVVVFSILLIIAFYAPEHTNSAQYLAIDILRSLPLIYAHIWFILFMTVWHIEHKNKGMKISAIAKKSAIECIPITLCITAYEAVNLDLFHKHLQSNLSIYGLDIGIILLFISWSLASALALPAHVMGLRNKQSPSKIKCKKIPMRILLLIAFIMFSTYLVLNIAIQFLIGGFHQS